MRMRTRQAASLVALVFVVLGATWAKASRYSEQAFPSPHFSTSVKIAQAPFHNGLGDEPQALISAGAKLPEPDWHGYAWFPD